MTEVLKNIALAAGACYLIYRIYSSYVQPIWSLRRGKSETQKADIKQTKPPIAPQHDFIDVA